MSDELPEDSEALKAMVRSLLAERDGEGKDRQLLTKSGTIPGCGRKTSGQPRGLVPRPRRRSMRRITKQISDSL